MNTGWPSGQCTMWFNLRLCSSGQQMPPWIVKGTSIIPSGKLWTISRHVILKIYCDTVIGRRNMTNMSNGLCEGISQLDSIRSQRNVNFSRKQWGTWDWVYQQMEFHWMRMKWSQWESGVKKGRQKMAGWTIFPRFNSFWCYSILTDGLFPNIQKIRNNWQGKHRTISHFGGRPNYNVLTMP